LHPNDLTTENAELAEKEKREMNNSDANGKDITLIPHPVRSALKEMWPRGVQL